MLRKIFATVFAASVAILTSVAPLSAHASTNEACTISGTYRSETLVGTAGDDVICGMGGNDKIRGLSGNDTILGGDGNDSIIGGSGTDSIAGESGNDSMDGGAGADSLSGGAGNDTVIGGIGDDVLRGDTGSDNLSSGAGDDALNGGGGADTVRTGTGDDTCAEDTTDRQLDSCLIDTTSPTISFLDSTNNEFQAGSVAVFQWIAEDPSQVVNSWASIGGPPGWVDWCGFAIPAERIDGSPDRGIFELRCAIPENAVNERYGLYVSAVDALGNSSVNWTSFEFTVVDGANDNRAPDLGEVRLPDTVSRASASPWSST